MPIPFWANYGNQTQAQEQIWAKFGDPIKQTKPNQNLVATLQIQAPNAATNSIVQTLNPRLIIQGKKQCWRQNATPRKINRPHQNPSTTPTDFKKKFHLPHQIASNHTVTNSNMKVHYIRNQLYSYIDNISLGVRNVTNIPSHRDTRWLTF